MEFRTIGSQQGRGSNYRIGERYTQRLKAGAAELARAIRQADR